MLILQPHVITFHPIRLFSDNETRIQNTNVALLLHKPEVTCEEKTNVLDVGGETPSPPKKNKKKPKTNKIF